MREGEPCRIITPMPNKEPLLWEAAFWFLFFLVFLGGSCVLWYVIFRAIGIVV